MSLDTDAREFGQHFKQGGWRLGLLVARNVQPHKGQGKPRPQVDEGVIATADDKPTKVSGTEFATQSGVSKQCIAYYYKAWQLAADDGKCPHAETWTPEAQEQYMDRMLRAVLPNLTDEQLMAGGLSEDEVREVRDKMRDESN